MKLQLPTISLICVDCLNVNMAIKVIEHCKTLCDFGDVRLLTSIPTNYPDAVKIKPLNSLIAYSIFMLKHLHEYVTQDMVMIIQRDGWILNTESWDDNWKNWPPVHASRLGGKWWIFFKVKKNNGSGK